MEDHAITEQVHCLLYILTSIWVLHTPNAGQNILFQYFFAKKLKKEEQAWNLLQDL